jgi:hypothetical protein
MSTRRGRDDGRLMILSKLENFREREREWFRLSKEHTYPTLRLSRRPEGDDSCHLRLFQ